MNFQKWELFSGSPGSLVTEGAPRGRTFEKGATPWRRPMEGQG